MRALPVDATAARASPKLAEPRPSARQQPILHSFLADGHDQRIAANAARTRLHPADQVESFEHLRKLQLGIRVPDPVAVPDNAALQQAYVSREDDPPIAGGRIRDIRILLEHDRVESSQAQESGELSEVHIQGEPHGLRRVGADSCETGELYRPERRIDSHILTVPKTVGQVFGSSIDQDDVYFRMRYTKRFDGVFHGGGGSQETRESALPVAGGQEIIELRVEPERYLSHQSPSAYRNGLRA